MHGLSIYMKEGLPFARDLSLENSIDSYLCMASNRSQRVVEAAKLVYANKTKDFWRIADIPIPTLFNGLEVFSSASDKAKFFAENFSRSVILIT